MKPLVSSLAAIAWIAGCTHAPTESVPGPGVFSDETQALIGPNDRIIPVRVLTPETCLDLSCPLIVFSHGAFATYDRYDALLIPLVEAGLQIVAPNHVDSEAHPNRDNYGQAESMPLRIEDVRVITEQYTARDTIALGHSYGALIAQFAGGAQHGDPDTQAMINTLDRVDLVVALSPPGPFAGVLDAEQWSHISTPMLIVTGTEDIVPGIADDWRLHLVSYDAAHLNDAFAVVYDDIDHYFNGMFGRERDATSDSDGAIRTRAMAHLNDTIIAFIEHYSPSTQAAPAPWRAEDAEFVTLHQNTERTDE